MNRVKKLTLAATATLALTVAAPATSAFAINQVGCDGRDDFVQINFDIGSQLGSQACFANSGVTAVNIGDVRDFSSGNNKVTVNYEFDGRYYSSTIDPWQGVGFGSSRVRVYEVRIW